MEKQRFYRLLVMVWPSIQKALGITVSFLLTFVKGIVSAMLQQVRGN